MAGWEVLRDAVMLQIHYAELGTVPPGTLDGLVLAGATPIADLRRRRLAGDRVLLADRERYRRWEATAEAPFGRGGDRWGRLEFEPTDEPAGRSARELPASAQPAPARRPESRQATAPPTSGRAAAKLPEFMHAAAEVPESGRAAAELPESGHAAAQLPESRRAAAQLPDFGLAGADPLDLDLAAQVDASAVLTPTGLIAAGDLDTLRSTIDGFERRRDERSVLTLPLGAGWLRAEWRPMLIKLLISAEGPKALALQESGDPFGRSRAVPMLADLARTVPDLGVIRTDLAGLGAVAFGAAFTAIGLTAGQRHIPAAGGPPRRAKGWVEEPGVPVLVPAFLSFHGGRRLAVRLDPGSDVAWCPCYACRPGLPLTRFIGADETQATAHNLAVLEMLTEELAQRPVGDARIRWWLGLCTEALARLQEFNAGEVPKRQLDEPAQLRQWAALRPV